MRTIYDTLLLDARESAADASTAPGTADVVSVLRHMTQRLATPAQMKAMVEIGDGRLEAGVTPVFLERVVSPLLANADRYARSTVTVMGRRRSNRVGVSASVTHAARRVRPAPGPGWPSRLRPVGPQVELSRIRG
ncbi:hypothetical protein [Streptomyces yatensis]|uniref:Uncharacterized protein n=1 Tax=Streptomyces yatensis TaxID=155177 RepID=A0ABN2IVI9_9ACTN|nr:hypothetical protein [Streptomyces yatensis]